MSSSLSLMMVMLFYCFAVATGLYQTHNRHQQIPTMPLLEELDEDIDNMDMDLAEFDPSLRTPLAPKLEKTVVRSQDQDDHREKLFPDHDDDDEMELDAVAQGGPLPEDVKETLKSLQILYPCYFDKNRSKKQGRRVSSSLAVANPLAQTVLDACKALHLVCIHEADKTHSQDWGNPGRVRVLIKDNGSPASVLVDNKRHLLVQVAKYMKLHETTLEEVKKTVVDQSLKKVQPQIIPVPAGLKMNTMVPLHSPLNLASDPMFKQLYEEQPQSQPQLPQQAPKIPKQKNKFMHVRR